MRYLFLVLSVFSCMAVFSQNLKLKSGVFKSTSFGGNLNYTFDGPKGEMDQNSIENYFCKLVFSNIATPNVISFEKYSAQMHATYSTFDLKWELVFPVYQKELPLPKGKYKVVATLHNIEHPNQILHTAHFGLDIPEYLLLDFEIKDLLVVNKTWDFPGSAIPFVKLFTKNSSTGEGYPDLRLNIFGDKENYETLNLGDNILSVTDYLTSTLVRPEDNINLYLYDYDTFSKNDEVIRARSLFKVRKGLTGEKSLSGSNVSKFNVRYKVYERPVFNDVIYKSKPLSDTSMYLPMTVVLPAKNVEFPEKRLRVSVGVMDQNKGNLQMKGDYLNYEYAANAYYSSVLVPILPVLNKNRFFINVYDQGSDVSYFSEIIDTTFIKQNQKFKWITYKSNDLRLNENEKIELSVNTETPKALSNYSLKHDIKLLADGRVVNNGISGISNKQNKTTALVDLSSIKEKPKRLIIAHANTIDVEGATWEVGSFEQEVDLSKVILVKELNLTISSSALKKMNEVEVEITIGGQVIYRGKDFTKPSAKQIVCDIKDVSGLFMKNSTLNFKVLNNGAAEISGVVKMDELTADRVLLKNGKSDKKYKLALRAKID